MRGFWLKAVGYPFVSTSFRRSRWMDWLRIAHAWFGIWGAVACLIFGVSTILLLHPELFPVSEPDVTVRALPPPDGGIASHQDLGEFVASEYGLVAAATLGEPPHRGRGGVQETRAVARQRPNGPESFRAAFAGISRTVVATYVQGNAAIEITDTKRGLFHTVTLMHLGRGGGLGWKLMGDLFSASLLILAITGFLLWNVFSGSRGVALGVFSIGLGLTLYFAFVGV